MTFSDPIVEDVELIREAIQSPDYVAGVSGWCIRRDGSAEFNAGTFRSDVVITGSDGTQLHAYADPTDGAVVELLPKTLAGETVTPARVRTYRDGNNRPTMQIRGPSVAGSGQGPATVDISSGGVDGGAVTVTGGRVLLTSVNEVRVETSAALHVAARPGINPTGGDLVVDGTITGPGVVYRTTYGGTTDASGFLTVTHGAPWTPGGGWFITNNPSNSFAQAWGVDNITATTIRLRFANVAGTGALASTAVAGHLFLVQ